MRVCCRHLISPRRSRWPGGRSPSRLTAAPTGRVAPTTSPSGWARRSWQASTPKIRWWSPSTSRSRPLTPRRAHTTHAGRVATLIVRTLAAIDAGVAERAADLLDALAEASAAVLSGHALHALDVGGSLQLVPPGSDLWLAADDVARLPMRRRGSAILAVCSSGQPALSLPDEAVGLPTALLSIGFTSVISTLWPVRDSVAFVTIARFLQLTSADPGVREHVALQDTRRWLRRATCEQLSAWLDGLQDAVALDLDTMELLRHEWRVYPNSAPNPWLTPTRTAGSKSLQYAVTRRIARRSVL